MLATEYLNKKIIYNSGTGILPVRRKYMKNEKNEIARETKEEILKDRRFLAYMWHNMYNRCYDEDYLEKSPAYAECEICDEWLEDRESFYNWVADNYYQCGAEQIDLDKDILVKGNKIYGPDTCVFAPHSINVMFEHIKKPSFKKGTNNKYCVKMSFEGKIMNLGSYDTEEEALKVFIKHKKASIIAKAEIYKDKIPESLYEAMINWKIEPEDLK